MLERKKKTSRNKKCIYLKFVWKCISDDQQSRISLRHGIYHVGGQEEQ